MSDRKLGTVVKIFRDKAYGFIKVDGERDIFFHQNNLDGCTLDDLHDLGDPDHPPTIVTFTIGQNRQGKPQADDVQITAE
jgi:cold shock CspA family protein